MKEAPSTDEWVDVVHSTQYIFNLRTQKEVFTAVTHCVTIECSTFLACMCVFAAI